MFFLDGRSHGIFFALLSSDRATGHGQSAGGNKEEPANNDNSNKISDRNGMPSSDVYCHVLSYYH